MSSALLAAPGVFLPYTPHHNGSNGAGALAARVADLLREQPGLLRQPDMIASLLENERRTGMTVLQVVDSSAVSVDGSASAILVLVVGQAQEDRVPAEDEIRERFGLTRRESMVAWCLAHRQSNDEIARALGVSPHTARHHTERVLAKLKVHSRRAVRGALLAPPPVEPGATDVDLVLES